MAAMFQKMVGNRLRRGAPKRPVGAKLDDVLRLTGPDRPHPGPLKLRPNLGIRESWRRWQRSTCHPSSTCNPLFLPHSSSPCIKSPSVTLAAWLRSPLLERSSHLFFLQFFPFSLSLDVDIMFDFRMLPASHQLLRVRMLLQSLVRHVVVLRMHPADLLH